MKPDYAEAHNNLGITLQQLGRLNDAEASYQKAIALKTDYAEAHYNLGITLQRLGRLDDAEVSHKKAIALKPNYAEAQNNLGNTLQEQGRLDEAEASYKQAIELKPQLANAYWNLYGSQKTIQSAEYWIDKCLEADENPYVEARLTKAALRFYQGEETACNELMQSELKATFHTSRSFAWVFSLPYLP